MWKLADEGAAVPSTTQRIDEVLGRGDGLAGQQGGVIRGAIISRPDPDDPGWHSDSDATIRHVDVDDAVGTDDRSPADPDSG